MLVGFSRGEELVPELGPIVDGHSPIQLGLGIGGHAHQTGGTGADRLDRTRPAGHFLDVDPRGLGVCLSHDRH